MGRKKIISRTERNPRFQVESNFPLMASIKQASLPFTKLQTLSHFGCDLYVPIKVARLLQESEVDLSIRWYGKLSNTQSRLITIKGNICYSTFVPRLGGVNFIGIRFIQEDPNFERLIKLLV